MTSSPRDILQISLGPSSNALTAHSLNLQGLAATDNHITADGNSTCDGPTTHTIENDHWVPRVLLIDEPTRFYVDSQVSQQVSISNQNNDNTFSSSSATTPASLLFMASPFDIQPLDPSLTLVHDQPTERSRQFRQITSTLAYSSHSRYYQAPSTAPTYRVSTDNPRHVNWDDMDDDRETVEEDPREQQARFVREQTRWQRETLEPLQEQLDSLLSTMEATSTSQQQQPTQNWHWMDFFMPPYSESSKVALPWSRQSHLQPHWDSYHFCAQGGDVEMKDWWDNILWERVRHILEESDSFQGVVVTTQGHGIYAGLATALLQEFKEETKNASRLVLHITNPNDETTGNSTNNNDNIKTAAEEMSTQASEGITTTAAASAANLGWQPGHVHRLRRNLSTGMALNDFGQLAHAVLPLHLPFSTNSPSLFEATAQLAMALDAATLPFRLQSRGTLSPNAQIGLLNAPFFGIGGSDSPWGSTVSRLNMAEYLTCLQPTSTYKILGLDALVGRQSGVDNLQLWQALQQGTSVERDYRMRTSGRDSLRSHPREVTPGNWLQDTQHGGILTSMSPTPKSSNRSLHHHFALSTAVRPILQDEMSKYLTALVQGMGIQYRPERSMSTVVGQTLGQLTQSNGYGAGAYWKSLIGKDQPVVAVLGNSTRSYGYLYQVASDMKLVLGPRYRGFYQRDVMNGALPEAEECTESLQGCWDLCDIYHPPAGSGLGNDDDDVDIDL